MEVDLLGVSGIGASAGGVLIYMVRSLVKSNTLLGNKVDKMHDTIIKLELKLELKNSEHDRLIRENKLRIEEVDKQNRARYHKLASTMQKYEVDFTKLKHN